MNLLTPQYWHQPGGDLATWYGRAMSRGMPRWLLVVTVALLFVGAQTAAGAQARFRACASQSVGIRAISGVAVFDIAVRDLTCPAAYRLIRGFPATLRSGGRYAGYTCRYRFSGALVAFDYVCVDRQRAYRFALTSE